MKSQVNLPLLMCLYKILTKPVSLLLLMLTVAPELNLIPH